MTCFFSGDEIARIAGALKGMRVENIAYCSFENRFAKAGGLAAVTKAIIPYLSALPGIKKAILISPFYPRIMKRELLDDTGKRLRVRLGKREIEVNILRHQNEYFIGAEGYFEADNPDGDPYLYVEGDPKANEREILKNALFFCKALPSVLEELDLRENVILHLQEWQTAATSLTVKEALLEGKLTSCACVQTLHNPYDCFIPRKDLELLFIDPARIAGEFSNRDGITAFQLGLPLSDGPLSTVSRHFATEFSEDILQTQHFAPHLQEIFKRTTIAGIDNGMFIPFPPEYRDLSSITASDIQRVKRQKRQELLHILDSYLPSQRFGELNYRGNSIIDLPDEIPIFVMSGRLDFSQKGYDVLLRAIAHFGKDEIKVALSPPSSDERALAMFRDTAERCKGNVTVFPMRMEQGYMELQMGSSFGLMPSIYEPFGAAIEYMAAGTVTIARATGGLIDQIDDNVSGLLFKEVPDHYSIHNIRSFAGTADQPEKRADNPWAEDMEAALVKRMRDAIAIFQTKPELYHSLILHGLKKAAGFDWETSAAQYLEVYRSVIF